MADEFVLADSGVVSRLTSRSEHAAAYNGWLEDRKLAINFQTEAELLSWKYAEDRMQRLSDLVGVLLKLPQTGATILRYAEVADKRKEFQRINHLAGNTGDGDVWIISSALEHGMVLFSHDRSAVQLARAMSLKVYTNLPELREGNPKTWPQKTF
jgi:predicted nucleic acid-binding protein